MGDLGKGRGRVRASRPREKRGEVHHELERKFPGLRGQPGGSPTTPFLPGRPPLEPRGPDTPYIITVKLHDGAVGHVHAANAVHGIAGPRGDDASAVEVAVRAPAASGVEGNGGHCVPKTLRRAQRLDGDHGFRIIGHRHRDADLRA